MHLGALWGTSVSFRVAWFIGVRPRGRRVRSEYLVLLGSALGFVRVHWVHWGPPWESSGSFGLDGLRPGGLRVRSWSLDSFGWALVVVGFGRCRCGHWDAQKVRYSRTTLNSYERTLHALLSLS